MQCAGMSPRSAERREWIAAAITISESSGLGYRAKVQDGNERRG